MIKEGRYDHIKQLISDRVIQKYSDIFKIEITKTMLVEDQIISHGRITKLIAHPEKFKIVEAIKQAEQFQITFIQMAQLINEDYNPPKITPNKKDGRYLRVRTKFRLGEIVLFKDIFKYVPVKVVHTDIGKGRGSFKDLRSFTVRQITTLSDLCELTHAEMFQLIDAQLRQEELIP